LTSQPQQRSTSRATTVISVVVCVATDLIALSAVGSAFLMSPAGRWDEVVLAPIQLSAFFGGIFAVLGALFRIMPVARGWLRWWWFLPPAVLLIAAIARFSWISIAYPGP
jgi:hypothetical protein